ncbi:type VI secretion system-associated protein TagF [Ectopseudomonas composti]|uniref:type VI secretion system-associated protein TagF n=1 Tax=Ectopseudomonas composti TaxID=658457 RepID=UPI00077476A0|nr:type VI secretion system-associated protein TagF [Pseudomonas composti]
MTMMGFYGKVASRGDFIERNLTKDFQHSWDTWLSAGLQTSQHQLGEGWLDAYLTSPLWRFALAPGVCGNEAMAGVLMPSIDRVGRYFPLTVACRIPGGQPLKALQASEAWFERIEDLLLSTLEEGAQFEAFEAAVQSLEPLPDTALPTYDEAHGLQHWPVIDAPGRLAALAAQACSGASLWWGRGSQRIAAGLRRCQGLPPTESFAAYLLGSEVIAQ